MGEKFKQFIYNVSRLRICMQNPIWWLFSLEMQILYMCAYSTTAAAAVTVTALVS